MSRTFVNQLRDGDAVEAVMQVRRVAVQAYRNRDGAFLRLRLGDRTGEIEARLWDFNWQKQSVPAVGDLISVVGQVTTYQEALELHIQGFAAVPWEEADPADYLPVTPRDRTALLVEIRAAAATVENPHLAALLDSFFSDGTWVAAFTTAPAAKMNHHAYIGGLLEHTANLARAVPVLVQNYPQADRDLLLTGVILHDVGKIEEYTWDRFIGVSDRGRLLGHIVLGLEAVSRRMEAIPGFPQTLRDRLLHIITSHHGRYEWQSPKRPKFLEACLVHHLDLLDGEAHKFVPTAVSPEEGWEWVDRLDRWVYRGPS
ncbi:MAG: HD domain-containing protein [Bacillota bacterium]|nr:HD domain-containing protein [Bacillota bacterium]